MLAQNAVLRGNPATSCAQARNANSDGSQATWRCAARQAVEVWEARSDSAKGQHCQQASHPSANRADLTSFIAPYSRCELFPNACEVNLLIGWLELDGLERTAGDLARVLIH